VVSASAYSVMPASAWLRARGDHVAISELAERGTKYSMIATVPVAIAIATMSGPFIELWVGRQYGDASGLVAVAVAAVLLAAPLTVGSQLLVGLDQTRVILRGAAGALAVNLALSTVLLHTVGVVGVFIGTLAGNACLIVLMGPGVLRAAGTDRRRFIRRAILPVVPAGLAQLVVGLALLQIDLPPLASMALVGVTSLGVYAAIAYRTAFSRSELMDLRHVTRSS